MTQFDRDRTQQPAVAVARREPGAPPVPDQTPAKPAFWQDEDAAASADTAVATDLARMFADIDGIGHDPTRPDTGYHRAAWTREDLALRAWFARECDSLGLDLRVDAAGNQWAWWGTPSPQHPGVTTGSHLDSVPDGGAFDGPLGVLSALAAVRALQAAGVHPARPIGILNASDEEGARFGIACFGSRVLTGALDPARALVRTDQDGTSLREALDSAGIDTDAYGPDPATLELTAAHVELHVEQGYWLADTPSPVAVATHIWPHGRWRVEVGGVPDHAGTTPMERRDDALLSALAFPRDAHDAALAHGARATVGHLEVLPGGANVIPGHVTLWLDARASEEEALSAVLEDLAPWDPVQESFTPATHFDAQLRARLVAILADVGLGAPEIGTAAGHDAGILQNSGTPTAMLFVRNRTGSSHTPTEFATLSDCVDGVRALTACLVGLAGQSLGPGEGSVS